MAPEDASMFQSQNRKTVAALAGVALVVAGLGTAALARATDTSADPIAMRIDAAFQVAEARAAGDVISAVFGQASKGDLPSSVSCLEQKWPNISSQCLATSDGTPVRATRYVTVGYDAGSSASVLVRMPSPMVASN